MKKLLAIAAIVLMATSAWAVEVDKSQSMIIQSCAKGESTICVITPRVSNGVLKSVTVDCQCSLLESGEAKPITDEYRGMQHEKFDYCTNINGSMLCGNW